MQKTTYTKKNEIKREWYVVDATGVRLGHLASSIAPILQGKNKACYSPNVDCGDFVIVINARNVDVHRARYDRKKYYHHSGYPGGIKEITLGEQMKKNPSQLIEWAIKGMLPQNKLGKKMMSKLFVYNDSDHRHESQKPETLTLNEISNKK